MSQQINLYNPAFEHKRDLLSLSGVVAAWTLAIGVVLLALLATASRTSNLEHTRSQLAAEREATRADMMRLAAQLEARKPAADLAAQVQQLEAGLASRKAAMATLQSGAIGNMRALSEYLMAFTRQSFAGLRLTRVRITNSGPEVVLEGRARRPDLVPEYLQRLNREQALRGHAFAELEMRRPQSGSQTARDGPIEFRVSTSQRRWTTAKDAQ